MSSLVRFILDGSASNVEGDQLLLELRSSQIPAQGELIALPVKHESFNRNYLVRMVRFVVIGEEFEITGEPA